MQYKLPAKGFPLSYLDGLAYLEANPDVKEKVQNGRTTSAIAHYLAQGINKHDKFPIATSIFPCEGNLVDLARDD